MEVSGQLHAAVTLPQRKERVLGVECTGGWVGPCAGLRAVEKSKISCPCTELNPNFLSVRCVSRRKPTKPSQAEPFFRSWQLLSHSRNSQHLWNPKVYFRVPRNTGLCPEPDESSSYHATPYSKIYFNIIFPRRDLLCGLVIRVPGYRSRGSDFLRSSGSGTGSTQPREDNWGATWIEK
jgi:hypothetical protein